MASFCIGDFFFFNDTATTEIYTLSLHDALPICAWWFTLRSYRDLNRAKFAVINAMEERLPARIFTQEWMQLRSEEHTSELQSRQYLVCRLLLEKKNNYYCHVHRLVRISILIISF